MRHSLRQYAQAYLQAAGDPRRAVAAFDACVQALQVPGLRGFIANTAIASDVRRNALAIAAPNQPTEALNLMLLLAHDRRLRDVAVLADILRREAANTHNQTHAVVTSAVPLPAPVLRRITAALTNRFKKEIWLESHVDPSIIAGLRIQVGDWVFDATRRGRLARLEHALTV